MGNKAMRNKAMGIHTMGSYEMKSAGLHTKGFTLIASLLLLLLLSGIAIGLMMMVNTEGKVGGSDLQNNVAYHSAEGGIEKMSADLAATFQSALAPSASQICNLSTLQPTMVGVTWKDYVVTPGQPGSACPGTLTTQWGQITSGPNQGLWAQIIPVNMLATAAEPSGQEVSMMRSAQVALIPVFQFGVFSESDLSFFSGPNFDFAGPIHTNGDLYPFVGSGSTLTFHSNLSAYGNVIRKYLANGWPNTDTTYTGNVMIPTTAKGCDGTKPACRALGLSEGSVTGAGGNPPQSSQNSGWGTLSGTTYNSQIVDGDYGSNKYGTGAKKLSMPFVNGTSFPYEIIRRPVAGDSVALSQSREANLAQIRVLLSDDPGELPGGAGDVNNVRLANVGGASPSNQYGIPTSFPAALPALGAGSTYNTYFAAASNALPDETSCNNINCTPANANITLGTDWLNAPANPPAGAQTLVPFGPPAAPVTAAGAAPAPVIAVCPPAGVATLPAGCPAYPYISIGNAANATTWNLIDGYLRVEYKNVAGNWNPVTLEWLKLGFARGALPPTVSGGAAPPGNTINPDAILLLQEPADRDGDGVVDQTGLPPVCTKTVTGVCTQWTNALPPEVIVDAASTSPFFGVTSAGTATQSITRNNWYPINFYDAREGEARDNAWGDNSCTTNGVMNAVEIDVGNLKRWLTGVIGTNGTNVDYIAQNGYVLYFSDRRGMLPNPNKSNTKSGDSGLEDVINSASTPGTPDGLLEPIPAGQSLSPEDVNQNGVMDKFGTANLGLGFYGTQASAAQNLNALIVGAAPDDPYGTTAGNRIKSCSITARKNWVSGARHVLRLVDGSLGNVPVRTDAGATLASPGGFTVASENPVYILGDYNSSAADPTWGAPPTDQAGHAATSVIADAVTFLSNAWTDRASLGIGGTGTVTNPGNRNAANTYYRVAVAGGKNLAFPWPAAYGAQDFGTDGGVHNFLRYLENWGGKSLNYKGSLVSLYYATYNTGVFKCCTTVYSPPTRNYSFDMDFANPAGLPPGTPLFRDVNSLGYRQLFTARTN
jgi:hypothetical protein